MRRTARLQVLAAAVCFGTTGTAQALGPDATTPATVGAVRILVGAALLAVVAWHAGWRRAGWSPETVVIGVAVAVFQLAFFGAVNRTGVGVGTVVAIGSAPLVTGVLHAALGGEPLDGRWARATALAVAGVAVLVLGGSSAQVDGLGVVFALWGGASYAVVTVAAKRAVDRGRPLPPLLARGFAVAALLLSPLLLTGAAGWVATPSGAALALFLGAVPTALAYTLFGRGLARLPSPEVSTLALAEPLTAAALGVAVVGERPGALAYVGAALVLAGLLTMARTGGDPVLA